MKKQRMALLAAVLAGVLGVTALAAGAKSITADLRGDITVRIDGVKQTLVDKNGNVVYPITYEGTTYLPIRAIGNLMDYDVNWDSATQTVILDRKTETKPEDLTLEKLTARVADAEASISALKSASTYAERVEQYALHSQTIDTLRKDVAEFAQTVNDQLRGGKITYQDYNVLTGKIDDLDGRLKTALTKLAAKTIDDETDKRTVAEQAQADMDAVEKRLAAQETAISRLVSASTYAERVKQYNAMTPELVQLNKDVSAQYSALNDHLRNGRVSYKEYNTLSQRCGGLDVRVKAAWDALGGKTILLADQTPDTATSTTYEGYVNKIAALDARADELLREVKNFGSNHNWNNGRQAYRDMEKKMDALEDDVDDLEDDLERDYRGGALTSGQYRELDRLLDKVEDKIDDWDDRFDWDD